jgi:hypothetical protein
MDKKLIILICLGILLAFSLGCKGKTAACASLATPDKIDQCYLGRIAKENITDIQFCDNIVGKGTKDDCYYKILNNTLASPLWMQNCTMQNERMSDICNMVVGIESGDPSACDEIADMQLGDRCYYRMLSKTSFSSRIETESCNKIYDESLKKDCLAMIAQRAK